MPRRGEKQSEETRRKIKEAALQRYAKRSERKKISDGRRRAILAELRERTEEPQSKRCSLCRETKSIDLFYTRRVKLKSDALVQRADSWCKACTRARQKKYRAKEAKRSWAEYRAGLKGHKLERYLEKQRARSAAYRRKNGSPVGKPRIPPKQTRWGGRVSGEPLALFLESLERGPIQLSRQCGVDERRIVSILGRETKTISLRNVDRILTGLDYAEELNTLYPPKQPRAGYRVVSIPEQ